MTRRQALSLATLSIAPLSGCVSGTRTQSPNPSPTEASESPSPTAAPDQISAADFEFEVSVLGEFTDRHPGRLRIDFTNNSDEELWGMDGPEYSIPFVDDDYASNDLELLLIPDDGGPQVDGTFPESLTNGCWTVSFEWPDAWEAETAILLARRVPPGETVSHEYSLYYIDECVSGTFTFENELELQKGGRDDPWPARLGFDLTISEQEMSASVHEPVI